jgi:uncharacterized tellurite resistance protein B-like protein
MELGDLTHDERVALVALLELVVESDGAASDDELDVLQNVIDALGETAYAEAAAEADERFGDEAELKAFLPSITRQDARELIYGTVLDTALPDAIGRHESTMLDWVAKAWDVAVQIEKPGPGEGA